MCPAGPSPSPLDPIDLDPAAQNPPPPSPHHVELRQFRYFVALAEERHFGRAAERLRIAQPGLSQQIKAMERAIGVPLVVRKPRGVELTAAGELFLDHARLTIELANRAVESARLSTRGKRGLLKVGTRAAGLHPTAQMILAEFGRRFPDVEVEIHPGFALGVLDALVRRALDVAIVMLPMDERPGHRFIRLGTVEILLAIPEGHRLASFDRIPRSELLKETLLDYPRSANPVLSDHIRRLVLGGAEHPHSIEVADVNEVSRVLMVAQGRGIAVTALPSMAALQPAGVVFRRVEEPTPLLEYGMVWFDANASAFVAEFVALAREVVAAAGSNGS